MDPSTEAFRNIHWVEYGQTILHPLAVLVILSMSLLLLNSRKQYIMVPFLIVAAFLTHMQRVVIGSFDFSMIRLILLTGVVRSILRNDSSRLEIQGMDSVLIAYVIVLSFAYIMLRNSASAVINRMGIAFEIFSTYFLMRVYLKTIDQVFIFIRALGYVFLFVAFFMFIEQVTRYNLFSILGGVPEITPVREGRLRAQGAFSHSIMAGTFGGSFAPLFWSLLYTGRNYDKRIGYVGLVSSFIIVWASSSSGPIITLLASYFSIFLWTRRKWLKYLLVLFVFSLIVLQFFMESPVWHLISRIDIVGGSTGWHRYYLIDQTIRRFREWALLGVLTTGYWGWGLNDITNMFVLQAVDGGVFTLTCFIIIILYGFRSVKKAIEKNQRNTMVQKLYWAWGCVLFSHCVSFFGVSYFGQMVFFWNMTLAVIASLPLLRVTTAE